MTQIKMEVNEVCKVGNYAV